MRKSEMYLNMAEDLASQRVRVQHYIEDPRSLDSIVKYMQETINVWEDVKGLVEKKYGNKKDEYVLNLKNLINSRLSYLKGTFTDGETNERKKKYIRNYDNIAQFFSKKALNYGLSKIFLKDFISTQFVYGNGINYYKNKGYEVKEENVYRTVTKTYSNGVEYQDRVQGVVFYIPDHYQIKESDFIKLCMFYDYPFMKNYEDKLEVYHMENPFEFYVKTEDKKSLYIPYECLKKKSISPAVKRMQDYFTSYYGRKAPEELKVLKSETFKALKRDIEGK